MKPYYLIDGDELRQALDALDIYEYQGTDEDARKVTDALNALRTILSRGPEKPIAKAAANIDKRTVGYVTAYVDIPYNTELFRAPKEE